MLTFPIASRREGFTSLAKIDKRRAAWCRWARCRRKC